MLHEAIPEATDPRRERVLLGGKARVFRAPAFEDDRGSLVPIDLALLDFHPVRVFWVAAPVGSERGGHGHRAGRQLLCAVSGIVSVDLRWGSESATVTLGPFWNALLIEAPVWARQRYETDDARLVVLSDVPFDPGAYLPTPTA